MDNKQLSNRKLFVSYEGERIMSYLVWVGPRFSDIQFSKSIVESICYFSDENPMPDRKSHPYGKIFLDFIEDKMISILRFHPDANFIFYNPKIAYYLDKKLRKYVLCLNEKAILNLLGDKIHTRFWLGNYVPVLSSVLLDSASLNFEELENKLGDSEAYIIQENRSSGGFGTFYVSRENQMMEYLQKTYKEVFIISPYIKEGYSVNVNALISSKKAVCFPPSLQIVRKIDNRLIYHGADYISIREMPLKIYNKIHEYSEIILNHIQMLGYRGIIGIDFLVNDGEVFFQEINPRYQASSFLIDAALNVNNYPDLTTLNLSFFYDLDELELDISQISVDYSFYKYFYKKESKHLYYVAQKASDNPFVQYICRDGWRSDVKAENDSYCYALIFSTNITSLNLDGKYNLYSNITGEEEFLKENISTQIGLKIALLNQGCNIKKNAYDFLNSKGIIKDAVFSSVDFQLSNGLFINAPVNLKFSDFSPFSICINFENELELSYYDEPLSKITVEMQPKWANLHTKNNIIYSKMAYLSTDRLRIKHEPVCYLKKVGKGCAFCSIPVSKTQFDSQDLKEVIEYLLSNPTFRHILIGGGSGNPLIEYKQIIEISKFIRSKNTKIPIYLMSLPQTSMKILKKYKKAGINEVAFNIEIWNRELAKKIMPGKGDIPLETYLQALCNATKLWGTNGNVRTALIVGLNDFESLIESIQVLCQNGIQPMLSVFRPMKNTKLESYVPPSNSELFFIYEKAQSICTYYNLKLGPSCNACKNNMLSI